MNSPKKVLRWFSLFILLMMALAACGPTAEGDENGEEEGAAVSETEPAEDLRYVLVPGSTFLMGSKEGEPLSRPDEYPRHEVVLPSFFIMQREVTNVEYQACVNAGVCTPPLVEEEGPTSLYHDPEFGNWPVVGANWFQAQEFCEWIDARLPTEAEWEKAARGREAFRYPWGNDDPTCDLANSAGCEEDFDAMRVLTYKDGESPYKLTETAGNVREWTADWYNPEFYTPQTAFMPLGPEEGELKVTRGGSWDDGTEELRTAARLPMHPDEQHPLVGFRCVPVGPAVAPVCQDSYRRFCDDPRYPPGDEPCIPDDEPDDCGGTSIANFGCPDDGLVTVTFSVPTSGPYDVTVGASGFDCEAGDGVIYCTGPEQPMGSIIPVTVCGAQPEETDGEPTTAELNFSAILFGRLLNPLLARLYDEAAMGNSGFCPEGYHMDAESGECMQDDARGPCPDGWTAEFRPHPQLEEEYLVCVPEDPNSCPENTEYNEAGRICQLVDPLLGCPAQFIGTPEGDACEPPPRRLSACLPGYWMDEELGCCVPFEDPCEEEGTYFETRLDDCLPDGPNGCPACTYPDPFEGCIPIPGCEPDGGEPTGNNLALVPSFLPGSNGGFVGSGFDPNCLPDFAGPEGCEPPTNGGDGCVPPFVPQYDPETQEMTCIPGYGPGSGCPRGYIMDPRTNCCVPLRNPCPDGDGEPGNALAQTPANGNGSFFDSFYDVFFGLTVEGFGGFNPYSGECENQETTNGCPPGTVPDDFGGCTDETGGGSAPDQCPPSCVQDTSDPTVCSCPQNENFNCPEGDCWLADTSLYTCTWTCGDPDGEFNPCASDDPNLVWVPELELCLPRGDDCCPPGYDWSTAFERCMPIIQQGFAQLPAGMDSLPGTDPAQNGNGEVMCADGYEYVDGVCVLASRRGSERCCWSVSVNVPRCVGPCKVGTYYNPTTGQCSSSQPGGGSSSGGSGCNCSPQDCNDIGTAGRCYATPCCN